MGKYYSDDRIEAWRRRAGHQRTSDVIAAERESREQGGGGPSFRQVSMEEAERMMAGHMGGGGDNEIDKLIRLLEEIAKNTRGSGEIG